jgi:predicted Fe-S protein YdhL (DUF1289 family)
MLAARALFVRATAENVPSPCISVCKMDAQRIYCQGCLRSINEIKVWSKSTDLEKKAMWVLIEQRLRTPAEPIDAILMS